MGPGVTLLRRPAGRLRSGLRRLAGARLRVPFTRLHLPLWLLAVAAIIFAPVGGVALVATNQPIFCRSCHEMSLHYATWSQSSHRTVGCEECHVMPGAVSMFRSKLKALRQVREHAAGDVRATAIQGHVPNANCMRCHPKTRQFVTYHGLKITHRDHWKMGVGCTYCHDRVAHGPKWLYVGVTSAQRVRTVSTPYQYTPTMETCYRCHDGKRAPNTCSTCHVTLGERRPTTFDPAWVTAHRDEVARKGRADCERCHLPDFCSSCHRAADPHPADWLSRHPEQARAKPEGCLTCHQAPMEGKPADIRRLAFCQACHSLRREHKQANWQQAHGMEATTDLASCQRCHQPAWCADCHALTRPHPPEWKVRHAAEAGRKPQDCRTCHKQDFCDSCHQSKQAVPTSHKDDWLQRHARSAAGGGQTCNTCHKPEFCQACHRKKAPASHGRLWLKQHGDASRQGQAACLLCHREQDCRSCHGTDMPHPRDWMTRHPQAAAKSGQQACVRCHRREDCTACHRGALPAAHRQPDWLDRHGQKARAGAGQCAVCHRQQFCNACHGIQMPHPPGWRGKAHGKAASGSQDQTCARCHPQEQCTRCHGLPMPHPSSWVSEHGKQANSTPATCTACHGESKHDCRTCHAALPPPSHRAEGWGKQHGLNGPGAPVSCTLCHGQNACTDCHARNKDAGSGKG